MDIWRRHGPVQEVPAAGPTRGILESKRPMNAYEPSRGGENEVSLSLP
jgi:hypothetical protein